LLYLSFFAALRLSSLLLHVAKKFCGLPKIA
jgi:hypothetical protein